jgi:osmotically-inducible protein OsmY
MSRVARRVQTTLLMGAFGIACHRGSAPTELRTEPQEPEPRADRLEREVRATLSGDPRLAGGGSIVVIVDGRRVLLEGWVASLDERTIAEADAVTVAGPAAVDDRLLVRGAARPLGSPSPNESR